MGVERKITDKWIFDAGGYVGAGGGGAAAQGGGLMIRPHVGLKYDFNSSQLGLNYTKVDFPNGDISSDAIGLTDILSVHQHQLMMALLLPNTSRHLGNVSKHRSHIAARVRNYFPASGSNRPTVVRLMIH